MIKMVIGFKFVMKFLNIIMKMNKIKIKFMGNIEKVTRHYDKILSKHYVNNMYICVL